MTEDGYTLAETLAALLMIGLAIGGLTAGVRVIGLGQAETGRKLAEGHDLRAVERALDQLFDHQGPFKSTDATRLKGTKVALSFDCGQPKLCGASLSSNSGKVDLTVVSPDGTTAVVLPDVTTAEFAFVGSDTVGDVWPPKTSEAQTLRSVVILAGAGERQAPVATARLWREQPLACAFDPISQDCRSLTP